MVSFDDVLEKRIGTGFYQIRTILIIGLVEICDAIEYQFMSILMSILKKEWNLSKDQISALSSSFLLGILLGNILFAFIADYIGRKVTFTFFSALSVFLIYYTSFS
jgi:MFS family permease